MILGDLKIFKRMKNLLEKLDLSMVQINKILREGSVY